MNTCHGEHIKPVYDDNVAVAHVSSLQDRHESTKVVSSELNKRGEVKRTNAGLPNTYHVMKLRKQS